MKKFYKENRFFCLVWIVVTLAWMAYISIACGNAPLGDYVRYLHFFLPKLEIGFSWNDIWMADNVIQRSPLQFLILVSNIRLFHYNAMLEVYAGNVLHAICTFMLYVIVVKRHPSMKGMQRGIVGAFLLLILFNATQWELLAQQFALSTNIRIFIMILGFYLTDRYLQNLESLKKWTIELGILDFFAIEMVLCGYSPAYVVSVGGIMIFHYIMHYKQNGNKYLKYYLIRLLILCVSAAIYMHGATLYDNPGMSNFHLLSFLANYVIGTIVMLGYCVTGISSTSSLIVLGMGIFIVLGVTVALFLYFAKGYYKHSLFPLCFLVYSFGVMGVICLGRYEMYGINYALQSRYSVEVTMALIGFLLLFVPYFCEESKTNIQRTLCGVMLILCLAFSLGIVRSDKEQWDIAPYRRIYYQNLIDCMHHCDELEPDEFEIFQTDEATARETIAMMKKYKIGIFYYGSDEE